MPRRLARSFFAQDVLVVAPALLGCTVTHAGVTVRVTETEAYAGHGLDPGSHAYRGRTPRTVPMFGPAGFTYVYFTYGMHWLLCLVTGPVDLAQAVLLRAGEVVAGEEVAAARRPGVARRDLCRGPARLATTLALDGSHSGLDFCPVSREAASPPAADPGAVDLVVRARAAPLDPLRVRTGPRVGVSGPGGDGAAYPWRYWLEDEPTVSVYRPGAVRVRRPSG
ncbi:DNA-3-methyladenine glycosylase [Lapillicoccus sp.]|uniref:DNA-3-methyladenine glycosylase n=1 Tax=Lapillicoccus sp. TaxID=1909287 RepID=UPI0025D43EE3|nr:DNA-3-methyladenine glycosylase [Lapillicoccus sp.]